MLSTEKAVSIVDYDAAGLSPPMSWNLDFKRPLIFIAAVGL